MHRVILTGCSCFLWHSDLLSQPDKTPDTETTCSVIINRLACAGLQFTLNNVIQAYFSLCHQLTSLLTKVTVISLKNWALPNMAFTKFVACDTHHPYYTQESS